MSHCCKQKQERFEDVLSQTKNFQKKTVPQFVPVILFWLFIFFFPVLMITDWETRPAVIDWRDIARVYSPLIFSMFIFAINQTILIPRYFIRNKIVKYILLNFLLIGIFFVLRELFFRFIIYSMHGSLSSVIFQEPNRRDLGGFVKFSIGFVLLTLVSCLMNISIRVTALHTKKANWARSRENAILKSELSFLKLQLSPHFLFNTLNNVAALIDIDSTKARTAVLQLSKMLRTILYDVDQETITIKEEIEILDKYLYLERLRFNENIECNMEVNIENENKRIIPLILMPLVENTIKHGINPRKKSFIHIRIEEKNGILLFHSDNSNFPRPKQINSRTEGGLGLSNTLKRLDSFYNEHYQYDAYVENDIYKTFLKVDLNFDLNAFEEK